MTTHHTSLYDDTTNPAPNGVLKQELVTLEQIPNGIQLPASSGASPVAP